MTRYRFNAGSTGQVSGVVRDPATGNPVPVSDLTTATLTLVDLDTFVPGSSPIDGVLNNRLAQDILSGSPPGDHNVTFDNEGVFVWTVQPADNVIVTPRRQVERHRAVFVFTWEGGASVHEVEIEVVNVRAAS